MQQTDTLADLEQKSKNNESAILKAKNVVQNDTSAATDTTVPREGVPPKGSDRADARTVQPGHGETSSAPVGWSPDMVKTMGFGFLAFALIVLCLMTWLMRHVRSHVAVLRSFGLLLIITAAVFLIVVGYGERQISPVLGLLGTIAGYLLGRTSDPDAPREKHDA